MMRFAMAAVLAAALGTSADAQGYYTSYGTPVYTAPAYTYPSVVTSGYSYYPSTYSSYYTPASYWSGYTYPSSTYSNYYSPGYYPAYSNVYTGTYVSPRVGMIGGRRAWRW